MNNLPKKKYSWGISEWKFVKTTTNIRQWGSSAFSCQEIMFKILQDRYYGLDSKQKLYNAAKGEKILLDGQFIILLFTVGCSMPFYVKIF